MQLTEEEVKTLTELEQKVTPSEWIVEKIVYKRELDAYFEISGPGKTDESVGYYPRDIVQTIVREIEGEASILEQDKANAEFIAAVRNKFKALLSDRQERIDTAAEFQRQMLQAFHIVEDGKIWFGTGLLSLAENRQERMEKAEADRKELQAKYESIRAESKLCAETMTKQAVRIEELKEALRLSSELLISRAEQGFNKWREAVARNDAALKEATPGEAEREG